MAAEEVKTEGIELSTIPGKKQIEGKKAKPHINPQTGEFWYEHFDLPADDPRMMTKRLGDIENRINTLEGKV